MEPWSVETGAARGSSRPGLPKPAQVWGAMEPVSARSGRQEFLRRDVPCCIGIEVAKAQWDMALRPSGERWAVPNDASGVVTLVERLQILHQGHDVSVADLPAEFSRATPAAAPAPPSPLAADGLMLPLAEVERRHVERVLHATGWNKARAARVLGIDIKTLNKKIRDFTLAQRD